ncbi:MAG: hypothetical protein Tsb009_11790 [Planctomycetaceae bacterium]
MRIASMIGLVLLSTLILAGCGKKDEKVTSTVTGTVTYKGKAVAGANVQFVVSGDIAAGVTDSEGKFKIENVPVGTAKISVTKYAAPKQDMTSMKPEDMQNMAAKSMGSLDDTSKNELPAKYRDPATSGLTEKVSEDPAENDFKLELK